MNMLPFSYVIIRYFSSVNFAMAYSEILFINSTKLNKKQKYKKIKNQECYL